MATQDAEPRYRFVDSNGNVVASLYWDDAADAIKAAFDDGTEVTVAQE